MKILTAEEMRQVEQASAGMGIPTTVLMENAGKAFVEEVKRILNGVENKHILVLVGPGNNGGDGLVAARYLNDWQAKVSLYLLSARSPDDANFKLVQERDIPCIEVAKDENLVELSGKLSAANAVIDAIFGTGKSRPLGGVFARVLERVAMAKAERPDLCLIALDLPSGLNADTGAIDPACLYADYTVTLGFPKPGLFNFPGAERAGKLSVVDIGIPAHLAEQATTELMTDSWARGILPERPIWANKGTFGKALVVAGSRNYIGAAYLACTGAIRVGAGLVTLATASSIQPVLATKLTEVTYLPLPESNQGTISALASSLIKREMGQYRVMVIGCGLGQSQGVSSVVKAILFRMKPDLPLVLDADALNVLSKTPEWWQRFTDDAILTPHPGEMARLANITIDEVQTDRIGLAKRLAVTWHKTLVLKGAYTVIARPDGQCRVSPMANPGLASAGTGDVLTGVIGGLVAQGLDLFDAASLGVYLHGKAGEMVREKLGDTGMIASDLLLALPLVIKQLKER